MVTFERVVRAIPLWLLREYLEEAGGTVVADGRLTGVGWEAELEQIEDFKLGRLGIGQVRFKVVGEETAVADLMAVMEGKLLRAGG